MRLANALRPGAWNSTLVLRCMGVHDRRWDGVSRPISKAWVPEVACGWPKGTHDRQIGNNMFRRNTPSAKGVYTFEKINYSAEKYRKCEPQPKTGEKVYWRLVEESDVEAIKKAFPDLAF